MIVGGVGGLLCGGNEELYKVVRPLVMALNAVPRITLVPIIVVVVGASPTADALSAAMLVVFIVFYNAVEGARSVSPETIEFARLLGASKRTRLLKVRGPYALAWVFGKEAAGGHRDRAGAGRGSAHSRDRPGARADTAGQRGVLGNG